MKTIFVITKMVGSYNEGSEEVVGATTDEKKAQAHVTKWNDAEELSRKAKHEDHTWYSYEKTRLID